jgi:ATP-dependent Clp protease ATP-binding subunit ClpA
VILFIDELHTIVGAGAAEGAIDASNILKPALARGEIRLIVRRR